MQKSEVLKKLAKELSLTQAETENLYNSCVEELSLLLADKKGFTLPGLGSFSVELRSSHTAYNPHYRKKILIPDKQVVRFSQSSVIRNELNGGGNEQ
ncbi:MAG: HU family DNA-binding protein [Balneolaceae bacterium]